MSFDLEAGVLQPRDLGFGRLFESIRDAAIVADAQSGRILLWNPAATSLFGYSADDAYRMPLEALVPAELRMQHVAGMTQYRATGSGIYITSGMVLEVPALHRDGRQIQIELRLSPLPDIADGQRLVLALIRDVSERKRMERVLHESEARFRFLFDQSPDGIILFEPNLTAGELRILDCNEVSCRMHGYARDELLGQPMSILDVGHRDVQNVVDHLERLRREGTMQGESLHRRKDGTLFPIEYLSSLLTVEGRDLVVGIDRDITERKRIEEALRQAKVEAEQANYAKSTFLATMSHEIRTPMNGVVGMADLLLDTELTPDQRDYAGIIRSSADSLLRLINDILDFSKVEAGKLDIEAIDFEPQALVHAAIATMQVKTQEKQLTLRAMIAPDLPGVLRGDPHRLRQVLLNLLSNAVKFTEQGEVELRVTVETSTVTDATVRFAVRDTGIGMSDQARTRLFQPFSQADGTTARKYGGTGLGLSISKSLVELMGGTIGVASVEGKGTTFWFILPLKRIIGRAQKPDNLLGVTAPVAVPRKEHMILVAEDNAVNRKVALLQLQKLGYRADVVTDGREAVAAAGQGHYALVLMDCQMPEMDGFEATAVIRAMEAETGRQHLPIVAMTASAMAGDREACLRAGMDDFLTKPVTTEGLQRVIERWLPATVPSTPHTGATSP